jgi:hypothetical protein
MLAALRVLHIDTSHAQAVLAAIEERLRSMAYQLHARSHVAKSHRLLNVIERQRGEWG